MQGLKVYRDNGRQLSLQGRKSFESFEPKQRKRQRSNHNSSFLPELVDTLNEQEQQTTCPSSSIQNINNLNPHPFHNNQTHQNPQNNDTEDVWAAYAELQSAYAALQASELSASTHLQNSSQLLTTKEKAYSKLKDKYTKTTHDHTTTKTNLTNLLNDTKATVQTRDETISKVTKKYKKLKGIYEDCKIKSITLQNNANTVLSNFDDQMLNNMNTIGVLQEQLSQQHTQDATTIQKIQTLEKHIQDINESKQSVIDAYKLQLKTLKSEKGMLETSMYSNQQQISNLQEKNQQLLISLKEKKKENVNFQEKIEKKNNQYFKINEDFNRLKKELLKAKHKYMESNRDLILMQTQTHTNHTRETNLMKELTSLRETLATIEQKNGKQKNSFFFFKFQVLNCNWHNFIF